VKPGKVAHFSLSYESMTESRVLAHPAVARAARHQGDLRGRRARCRTPSQHGRSGRRRINAREQPRDARQWP